LKIYYFVNYDFLKLTDEKVDSNINDIDGVADIIRNHPQLALDLLEGHSQRNTVPVIEDTGTGHANPDKVTIAIRIYGKTWRPDARHHIAGKPE
jgi:hypothetical protein